MNIQVLQKLNASLPDECLLIGDGGDFVGTASYVLKPRVPFGWLDPGPFGTLGVGGGFALGAALLFPERRIYILYGDGSAGYSIMEKNNNPFFDENFDVQDEKMAF